MEFPEFSNFPPSIAHAHLLRQEVGGAAVANLSSWTDFGLRSELPPYYHSLLHPTQPQEPQAKSRGLMCNTFQLWPKKFSLSRCLDCKAYKERHFRQSFPKRSIILYRCFVRQGTCTNQLSVLSKCRFRQRKLPPACEYTINKLINDKKKQQVKPHYVGDFF